MKEITLTILLTILTLSLSAQSRRALLVGISTYTQAGEETDSPWENIHGENDIRLLAPSLSAQGFSVDSLTSTKATARSIRAAMKRLVSDAGTGDIIFVHFSCHGQPVEDMRPYDEKDGWDESIIPVDAPMNYEKGVYEGKNHILDDELNAFFVRIRKKVGPKGFVYAVMDACHMGTSYRSLNDTIFERGTNIGFSRSGKTFKKNRDKSNSIYNYKLEHSDKMADIYLLEACRADEKNTEIRRRGVYYGPLSYYVNAVISREKIGKDPSWTRKVMENFSQDFVVSHRSQHLVIESSLQR